MLDFEPPAMPVRRAATLIWSLVISLAALCLAVWPASAGAAVSEPSPSLFSVSTQMYDNNFTLWNEGFAKAKGIGARWVEFTVGPSNATGNYGTLDYEVQQARKQGLGVLLNFGGIQPACGYTASQLSSNGWSVGGCPPRTAGQLATYANFVRTIALRYRGSVDTYESWREENNRGYWEPAANPSEYAAFLKMQYSVFQSLNRSYGLHLKLLFGGPNVYSEPIANGNYPTLPFIHLVDQALHGAKAFDGVGLHAYRYPANGYNSAGTDWGPGQSEWDFAPQGTVAWNGGAGWLHGTWTQDLTWTERQLAADGYPNTPLWLTEFGWDGVANPWATEGQFAALSASWRPPYYGINDYPSYSTQATWLTQAYNDLLAMPFVKAAFWFNLRDDQPNLGFNCPDPPMFRYMGLFNYSYSAKPALSAWESLARAHPYR